MFCTQCGKEQDVSAKFCHSCGKAHNIQKKNSIKNIITDPSSKSEENSSAREFFVLSVGKFIILSISTFGLYELYWFYKNWVLIKKQENSNISPVGRAIFAIFFFSELANKVLNSAKERGYDRSYSPVFLALAYFISGFLFNLPGIYYLLGFIGIFVFIPIIEAILYNNEKSDKSVTNANRYSTLEIISSVIGGLVWLAVLVSI